MEATVRVLIAEAQRTFAQALEFFLGTHPRIEVAGVACPGDDAVNQCLRQHPDVVLIGVGSPAGIAITTAERLSKDAPEARVVFLASGHDDRLLLRAIEVGVSGWISKEEPALTVAEAVVTVASGRVVIPPERLARLVPLLRSGHRDSGNLTSREREVLRMLVEGCSTSVMAERLVVTPKTVRNYVQRILFKLGVHSRLEAASRVLQDGLVDSPLTLG